MDASKFAQSPTGRVVTTPRNYRAFVPHPLPPALTYSPGLVTSLSEADRALGRLAGVGERLPNPDLLIMPYMRREAVLSSRIEGTQASLSDLLFFEAGQSEPAKRGDIQEVRNYVEALNHGLQRLPELPLGLRLVQEIHATLMSGVRGGQSTPGEFRRTQNWIGPPGCSLDECTYVPPPVEELAATLGAWEAYLHARDATPPLVRCALIHYQFEAIHPFLDGNGRVGRLLIPLFLCAEGYLPQPLLYLSAFFERHRGDYYGHLLGVSREGRWEDWIAFFLRGVARQATDAIERSRRILALRGEYRRLLHERRAPVYALELLDLLFKSPVISVNQASVALELSYMTARAAVARLMDAGILSPVNPDKKRGRLFWVKTLFDAVVQEGDQGHGLDRPAS
jgi:Fic family protein